MFSWGTSPNTSGTDLIGNSIGQPNNGKPPSYNESFKNITIATGPNKGPNQGQNNGKNKGQNQGQNNGKNNQEEHF